MNMSRRNQAKMSTSEGKKGGTRNGTRTSEGRGRGEKCTSFEYVHPLFELWESVESVSITMENCTGTLTETTNFLLITT